MALVLLKMGVKVGTETVRFKVFRHQFEPDESFADGKVNFGWDQVRLLVSKDTAPGRWIF